MYKQIIEEITFNEIKEKCNNGEIDIKSPAEKIWVVNYLGDEAENQANHLLNMFVDNDIAFMVEINPKTLFKKIYSTKDHNNSTNIIAIFNDNIVDRNKILEVYDDTIDEFTLAKYIESEDKLSSIEKEEYDPLGFTEHQKHIDNVKERYNNGEISFGEMLKELGYIEYDKELVTETAEKLIKKEITFNELNEMYESGQLTSVDLVDISMIIEKEFPRLNEEFNKLSK